MWYAVQVITGQEKKVQALCEKMIPKDILEECFIPLFEKKSKYLGSWHTSLEVLFPGYLFMVSHTLDALRIKVKNVPTLVKILGDGQEVIPLQEREIEFLKNFGKEEHLIRMSQGYIENERIIITQGPMKDFRGLVKKVDRHKRSAVIEVEFFGRKIDVHVGLEIVKKIVWDGEYA